MPARRETLAQRRMTPVFVPLWFGWALKIGPQRRSFRAVLRRLPQRPDSSAERGGFEPPVPQRLLWAGIRPEFGALSGPTKSIHAGENLFALGFGFASAPFGSLHSPGLNADAGGVGDQTKASDSNPSASITVTRCPSRTASMPLTMLTAPNPMTVTCWRASFPDALSDARPRCGGNDRAPHR